jgi:hypothetical protein
MVHHFFHDPRTIRRLHEGPLGEYLDALAAQLQDQGYACESARLQLRVVAELSRWLQRQGRPRCASRRVFIRQRAPLVGFANWLAISALVARALARAGIAAPHTGAHVFRHYPGLRTMPGRVSLAGQLLGPKG